MTLQQLKYLVQIYNSGSINKASKNLFISQPSISKAIKELESEFDIDIFYRDNKKKLQFTNEGTELLWYAKDLIEQAENIENTFAVKNRKEYVRLIVSSQHYAFVVKAFIDLIDKHKKNNYKMILGEKKTTQIIEDVFTQHSALGVICISNSTENFLKKYLSKKNLEFNPLKTVDFHAFMRSSHPLASQGSVTLEDLSNYPFVSYEQENYSLNFSEEAVILNSKQTINVLDRATMNNIICNTNSYNIGTGFLLEKIIDKEMISIPIRDLQDKMTIGWIKNKNTKLSTEAEEFLELCKKYI